MLTISNEMSESRNRRCQRPVTSRGAIGRQKRAKSIKVRPNMRNSVVPLSSSSLRMPNSVPFFVSLTSNCATMPPKVTSSPSSGSMSFRPARFVRQPYFSSI